MKDRVDKVAASIKDKRKVTALSWRNIFVFGFNVNKTPELYTLGEVLEFQRWIYNLTVSHWVAVYNEKKPAIALQQ